MSREVGTKKTNSSGVPKVEPPLVRQEIRMFALRDTQGAIEVKQLSGRDHLVVPSIIIVEGVLHASNAEHPALALAEEFGIFPGGWDGRPIVYNHPKINDSPVSANSPDGWENEVIGQLFGSMLKSGDRLRTNLWIDKEKAPEDVVQALEDGESFEVSTGLYALEEEASGEFNGKKYEVIWRNIVPDHLAILPPGTLGACNNNDGCGAPRANRSNSTGDSMTTPAKNSGKCGCQPQSPTENAESKGIFKKILDNFLQTIGVKTNELSDSDRRTAVEAALSEVENGPCYVMAIYTDKVVYMTLNQAYEWETFQRTYSVDDGSAVTIGSEATEVRPETQFVPLIVEVNANQRGNDMNPKTTSAPAAAAAGNPASTAAPAAATPAAIPVGEAPNLLLDTEIQRAATPEHVEPKANTVEDLLLRANDKVQAELKDAITYVNARRSQLVKALAGKKGFTEEELKATDIRMLEKLAGAILSPQSIPAAPIAAAATPEASAESRDFSGAGGSPTPQANEGEERFTPPMQVFPFPAKTQ